MTTMEINILAGAASAAAALPEKAAETAAENTAAAVVQPVTLAPVAEDKLADSMNSQLGIYISDDNTEKLPNWAVLTALRAYGMNLKPQATEGRPAPVVARAPVARTVSAPVAAPVTVPVHSAPEAKAVVKSKAPAGVSGPHLVAKV